MSTNNLSEQAKPNIQVLSKAQIQKVHEYSLKILETTGIKVESKAARDIFASSAAVRLKNEVVYISSELVNHTIKTAPSGIQIYDKKGETAFQLGKAQKGNPYFGIGVTNTFFQDIESDQVEPFQRKHLQACTKLGDILPNFDMVSTIGIPSDAPVSQLGLYSTLDMYANTSKPLVLLIPKGKNIKDVFALLHFLHGDIVSKPFIIPYFNLITPLVLNKATTDKVIASIACGLPFIFSNYSMYGATSPVSEGGTLALLNAELLAGLVFSQLVKEGSPVILGSLPAAFNMKTMGSNYSPSSYLINLACAEMMDHYEIPHCGTSGSGKGRGPDLFACGELWMNHLTSCMGKVGMAPFVGGNFDSTAFSPTTVVMSDFIIGEARKFSKGFLLNDDTVNLTEMEAIGYGGNYLTSDQTLFSLANLDLSDSFWEPMSIESWKQQGYPTIKKKLRDYSRDLYALAELKSKENGEIIQKGEDFIKEIV